MNVLSGPLNKDIGTHDCKASTSMESKNSPIIRTSMEAEPKAEINGQQRSKQGLCVVPSKGSKTQRNCPKKK
jgi:hypothetical protein